MQAGDGKAARERVFQACLRCRRQKLKCDVSRPCILCVRADTVCLPQPPKSVARLSKRPREEPAQSQDLFVPLSTTNNADVSEPSPTRPQPVESGSLSNSRKRPSFTHNSAIGFARNVFNKHSMRYESSTSAIPGGEADPGHRVCSSNIVKPDRDVLQAMIDAYFQSTHWFLFILHEQSFRSRALELLSTPTWENQDLGDVLLLLMVAAFGLPYVQADDIRRLSLDESALQASLISTVRANLLQTLDASQISSVQICLLLGTYYIYHGSPNLAWSILGLGAKVAYALSLHQDEDALYDTVTVQVRRRVWGHVKISDTFTAMIYGRPASVRQELSETSPPDDSDDSIIPFPLSADPAFIWGNRRISKLTFHLFRYQLYDIISQALCSFQLLRLQLPLSNENMTSLILKVESLEASLSQWYDGLPPFYKTMSGEKGREPFQPADLPPEQERLRHVLGMQALLLQLTYDNAMILVHRPLLEYRIASGPSVKARSRRHDPFSRSLDICFRAALRTSRILVSPFENVYPSGFVSMHLLTAGIILCLLPTSEPFSKRAQQAKSGILRLIRSSKALSGRSQIAAQGHQLLATLMKAVLQSEFECALTSDEPIEDENVEVAGDLTTDAGILDTDSSNPTPQRTLGNKQHATQRFESDQLSESSINLQAMESFETTRSDFNFEPNHDMSNTFDSFERAMFGSQESVNMPYPRESLWQPYIFDPLQNNFMDTMDRWEGT